MIRFFSALLLTVAATMPSLADDIEARGKALAETNCTECHAVGLTGDSPFKAAPPFRDVAPNYTSEELTDGFMEGLAVRHQAMPDWQMSEEQAESLAAYILSLNPATPEKTDNTPATHGRDLLEANCGACHALEQTGDSPLTKAPPFRDVVKRYPPSNLEEALAEGIVTGHNEMPELSFSAEDVSAIIDYLNSLKVN